MSVLGEPWLHALGATSLCDPAEMIWARGVAAQNRLPLLWTFRGATGVVCGALHREVAKPT